MDPEVQLNISFPKDDTTEKKSHSFATFLKKVIFQIRELLDYLDLRYGAILVVKINSNL